MIYHSGNTELYRTKNNHLAVLVHKESQTIVARYRSGLCMESAWGLSEILGNIIHDHHASRSWIQLTWSEILAMSKRVGEVR